LKFAAAVALNLVLLSALSLVAQTPREQLTIHSHMDIYRSGEYDDGSDGYTPAVYKFSAKPGQILVFSNVTGGWTCRVGDPGGPADGAFAGACFSDLGASWTNPIGPFSGYTTANFANALVGMFLEDSLPTSPATPLSFVRGAPTISGEISTDFETLSPVIGQVFFIGDGMTGTGSGKHQIFFVPPTATRLYLAFIDTCAPPGPQGGAPGCYSDNGGSITVDFGIYKSDSGSISN